MVPSYQPPKLKLHLHYWPPVLFKAVAEWVSYLAQDLLTHLYLFLSHLKNELSYKLQPPVSLQPFLLLFWEWSGPAPGAQTSPMVLALHFMSGGVGQVFVWSSLFMSLDWEPSRLMALTLSIALCFLLSFLNYRHVSLSVEYGYVFTINFFPIAWEESF